MDETTDFIYLFSYMLRMCCRRLIYVDIQQRAGLFLLDKTYIYSRHFYAFGSGNTFVYVMMLDHKK